MRKMPDKQTNKDFIGPFAGWGSNKSLNIREWVGLKVRKKDGTLHSPILWIASAHERKPR